VYNIVQVDDDLNYIITVVVAAVDHRSQNGYFSYELWFLRPFGDTAIVKCVRFLWAYGTVRARACRSVGSRTLYAKKIVMISGNAIGLACSWCRRCVERHLVVCSRSLFSPLFYSLLCAQRFVIYLFIMINEIIITRY
jgi:hypothetical protein